MTTTATSSGAGPLASHRVDQADAKSGGRGETRAFGQTPAGQDGDLCFLVTVRDGLYSRSPLNLGSTPTQCD